MICIFFSNFWKYFFIAIRLKTESSTTSICSRFYKGGGEFESLFWIRAKIWFFKRLFGLGFRVFELLSWVESKELKEFIWIWLEKCGCEENISRLWFLFLLISWIKLLGFKLRKLFLWFSFTTKNSPGRNFYLSSNKELNSWIV